MTTKLWSNLNTWTALPNTADTSLKESVRVWVNERVVDWLYPPPDYTPIVTRPVLSSSHGRFTPFRGNLDFKRLFKKTVRINPMTVVITETHIHTVILPAVDAAIQGITELIRPWPVPVSPIEPERTLLNNCQPIINGIASNVIPFRPRP